jgi:type VII secretion protein EccE
VKARAVTADASLPAVLAAEAAGIAAFAALPPYRFGWWPAAAITAAAAILLLGAVHRRNAAAWATARARWMRTRRHITGVGAAIDVSYSDSVYGVRTAAGEAVAVLEVTGRAYSPTFLRGSTTSLTHNVLPLGLIAELMEQPGGLRLSIDVISAGHRVRPGSGYPQLYSTLLADRGAAGQRTTHLIVRVDIGESTAGLAYRRSIGSAAAAAADRILKTLQQQGIRCKALGAAEHDALLDKLSLGLASPPTRPIVTDDADLTSGLASSEALDTPAAEPTKRSAVTLNDRPKTDVRWATIDANPGYATSYYFSPEDITDDAFNQMWALRSDHLVHATMLRKPPGGPVLVSALVRTTDPQRPEQPPTLFLNPLPGDQYAAALRAAPTSRPRIALPARPLGNPAGLNIPIGATGILLGTAVYDDKAGDPQIQRDDMVMWALTDAQQPTRIALDTSEFYARQLLIRAAAAGERIAIYSREPRRWYSVSQPHIAVVEPSRPAEFVPTIIVNDHHTAPSSGLSSTVITLGPGSSDASTPDLLIEQSSDSTVRITTVEQTLDVAMVVFRQEQTWTG